MGKRVRVVTVAVWLLAWMLPGRSPGAEAAKPKPERSVPWAELKALVLSTRFDNIRYPHMDKEGSVTFVADDANNSNSKGTNHGIYRYGADGSLACLVRGGETTVPAARQR